MSGPLDLVFTGDWNGNNWFDATNPGSLVPAGSGNDLVLNFTTAGAMIGDVSAGSISVVPGYFAGDSFQGGTVSTQFFELSENPAASSNELTLSGGALEASATLIVGQLTTLNVTGGATLSGPTAAPPGLQDFGDIEVNGGTVTSNELDVYDTFNLISGTGTLATLIVGSYTGLGGFGGTGVLDIASGGSIDVSGALEVAVQTSGTGTIDVNGGTLTVGGDADVGLVDAGGLTLTAGGSMSVVGTLDVGTGSSGVGTLSIDGSGSTLSAEGGLIVGDAGIGTGTVSGGASVGFNGELIVGDTGTGTLTVSEGTVGTVSRGTIAIGASAGGNGGIDVGGAGSALNGQVLAVGGSGIGAGGNGTLSIGAGGSVDVSGATVWSTGTVLLSGGNLTAAPITVDGAVSGYGTLNGTLIDNGAVTVNGGMLVVVGAVGGGGTLAFGAGGGTLALGAPGTIGVSQVVSGLANGDRIELAGLTVLSAAVSSPGTITVATGTGAYIFNHVSFAAGASQVLTAGHDALTGSDYVQVACFAAGTRIAGAHGEVAVENLRVGDAIALAGGGLAEAIWIGRREIDIRRHPAPRKVWPVRVRAGAFDDGKPRRDLWLSPDHAVLVDEMLIPIKFLANGMSIEQVPVDKVAYYHIELAEHDVLLAEGLPAESYLDTGDRSNFTGGGGALVLHPDFWDTASMWEARGCAPLVVAGPDLDAVRQRLDARARQPVGWVALLFRPETSLTGVRRHP